MRALTASRVWLAKKKFEGVLHAVAPSLWIPEYTMVAFTRMPYHEARKRAAKQDRRGSGLCPSFLDVCPPGQVPVSRVGLAHRCRCRHRRVLLCQEQGLRVEKQALGASGSSRCACADVVLFQISQTRAWHVLHAATYAQTLTIL